MPDGTPNVKRARLLALLCFEIRLNLGCSGVAEGGLSLLHECGEAGSVIYSDVRQHLAVELDSGGLKTVDELRVADVVDLGRGVDAHDPERAVLALLLLASAVGELQSALDSFLRCLVELRLGEEITACSLEYLLAAVVAFCSTFYTGHLVLLLVLRCAAGGRMRLRADLFTRLLPDRSAMTPGALRPLHHVQIRRRESCAQPLRGRRPKPACCVPAYAWSWSPST